MSWLPVQEQPDLARSPTASASITISLAFLNSQGCDCSSVIGAVQTAVAEFIAGANGELTSASLEAVVAAVPGVLRVRSAGASATTVSNPVMIPALISVFVDTLV